MATRDDRTQHEALSVAGGNLREDFHLTKRELEILRLVATGMTDAQVAERLVLSRRTISKHLQLIYSKLNVNSINCSHPLRSKSQYYRTVGSNFSKPSLFDGEVFIFRTGLSFSLKFQRYVMDLRNFPVDSLHTGLYNEIYVTSNMIFSEIKFRGIK